MNTGTLIYIITMGWALIIQGGITYLFSKKQDYTLLSGFSNLPKVNFKTNGFATSGILKGHFNLEEPYGNGLLFIQKKSAPYLYVATEEDYVIINRKKPNELTEIYKELSYEIKNVDGVN